MGGGPAEEENELMNDQKSDRLDGSQSPEGGKENFSNAEVQFGAKVAGAGCGTVAGSFLIGAPIIGGVIGYFVARSFVDEEGINGDRARRLGLASAKAIRRVNDYWNYHQQQGTFQKMAKVAEEKVESAKEIAKEHKLQERTQAAFGSLSTAAGNAFDKVFPATSSGADITEKKD